MNLYHRWRAYLKIFLFLWWVVKENPCFHGSEKCSLLFL